ncbi:MAG: hypothetical protein U0228_25555 [Myxococcaceae bacterium]
MRSLFVVAVVVALSGCGGVSPCSSVTCSFHGTCTIEGVAMRCLCDPGFTESSDLTCIPLVAPPTPGPSCVGPGAVCSVNNDCCSFRAGSGFCVSGRCADSCTSNSGCVSGCCALLVSGNRACSSPSSCTSTCAGVNSFCSVNGDCCNWQAGTGFCVDHHCADSCSRNSDCVSGCCASTLQGSLVCSARSFCP